MVIVKGGTSIYTHRMKRKKEEEKKKIGKRGIKKNPEYVREYEWNKIRE